MVQYDPVDVSKGQHADVRRCQYGLDVTAVGAVSPVVVQGHGILERESTVTLFRIDVTHGVAELHEGLVHHVLDRQAVVVGLQVEPARDSNYIYRDFDSSNATQLFNDFLFCQNLKYFLEKVQFPDKKAKLTGIQKLSASRVGKVLSES
jgi:hypothetical protein